MLELERKGNEVFFNGKKLTIVAQSSKGEGKEVVKVVDLEGSNGQKYISLSKLNEGINEIECQGRDIAYSKKYELTLDEKLEVEELQSKIDSIIEVAKSRYIPKTSKPITKMDDKELEQYIATCQTRLNVLKSSK